MRTSHSRYPVKLSEEQHRWLETMLHMSSTPAKHYLVARVLLMSDQSQGEQSTSDGQIAEIELSGLAQQGLAHNIATIEDLCQQVQNWQEQRNQRVGK